VRLARRDLLRAGAVLSAAALTGCTTQQAGVPVPATSLPAETSEPQVPASVRLGVFEYRPYVFEKDGELTGEVVEVVRAVCRGLGATLQVSVVSYTEILPKMAAGDFHLVGGLSIAPRNCANLDFSVPDHISLSALAVRSGNPEKVTTFADIKTNGARLAVVADSLEFSGAVAAGIEGLRQYPSAEEAVEAVRQGDVDCAAYDDITLRDLLAGKDGLELAESFDPPGGSPVYGFGFRKGENADLRASFDQGLATLHRSGDWLRLAEPFGFAARNAPDPNLTAARACAGR
jgi:polar amino acid transport system substrate-binding protein